MSGSHPSEALLARFEHDRMSCEIVPSAAGRAAFGVSLPASLGLGIGIPVVAAAVAAVAVGADAAVPAAVITGFVSWILPFMSYLSQRVIEVSLDPKQLEITWRVGATRTGRRTLPLREIRSVYAVPQQAQTTAMFRVVGDGEEVWIPAGGVPVESLQWLAEEIGRAAHLARERDAAGPPAELDELLSARTRDARDRYVRHARAKSETA